MEGPYFFLISQKGKPSIYYAVSLRKESPTVVQLTANAFSFFFGNAKSEMISPEDFISWLSENVGTQQVNIVRRDLALKFNKSFANKNA